MTLHFQRVDELSSLHGATANRSSIPDDQQPGAWEWGSGDYQVHSPLHGISGGSGMLPCPPLMA